MTAERAAAHVHADALHQLHVAAAPLPVRDALQYLKDVAHAEPAREALAARLHLVERHKRARQVDDRTLLVADDETAGAEHRARRDHRVEVEHHVELLRREHAAERPAGLQELQRLAVRFAAAHSLDDVADRQAERHLDESGVADVAGEAGDSRACALLGADAREPLRAPPHDLRRVAERLDVVDVGRLAPHAVGRREGRAEPGHGALALDRLHQRRLLARNVRFADERDLHVERELRAEDAAAEHPVVVARLYRGARAVYRGVVAVADEDDAVARTRRVARDDAALHERERVGLQDRLVVERAGVALLAVAEDVLLRRGVPREEAPLHARRERRATAAAQAGVLHLVQCLPRRERGERFVQPGEAAARDVLVDVGRVDLPRIAKRDAHLSLHHRQFLAARNTRCVRIDGRQRELRSRFFANDVPLHNGLDLLRAHVAVEHTRPVRHIDVHDRLRVAESGRAHLGDGCLYARPFDGFPHRRKHFERAHGLTHEARPDAHPGPGVQFVPPRRGALRENLVRLRHACCSMSAARMRSTRLTASSSDMRPASS